MPDPKVYTPEMNIREWWASQPANPQWRLPSMWLTAVAALLWVASLPTGALIGYGADMTGWAIFLTGWSQLVSSFVAWFANVFFLWALVRVLKGSTSGVFIAWIAVLLSADTYRVTLLPSNGSSDVTYLYGYGVGALLWFCALFVMAIASSVRLVELEVSRNRPRSISVTGARASAVVLGLALAFLLAGTVYICRSQRAVAAPAEHQYLARALFKRGAVCTIPDIQPRRVIRLGGPLELVRESSGTEGLTPESLLQWGIPVVRENGVDHSLREPSDFSTLVLTPASGPPAAILSVSVTGGLEWVISRPVRFRDGSSVSWTLKSATGEVGFSGTWRALDAYRFCPSFDGRATETAPPRSLLMSAVRAGDGSVLTPASAPRGIVNSTFTNVPVLSVRRARDTNVAELAENSGCPASVGVVRPHKMNAPDQPRNPVFAGNITPPAQAVRVGDSFHVWTRTWDVYMTCDGDAAYLANGLESPAGSENLYLEKRHLPDLRPLWKMPIHATFDHALISDDAAPLRQVRVQSVRTLDDRLVVVVAYSNPGDTVAKLVQIELASSAKTDRE
jgi:hypothetical protein